MTGGAGFIGSHVADLFLAKGFDVTIADVREATAEEIQHGHVHGPGGHHH